MKMKLAILWIAVLILALARAKLKGSQSSQEKLGGGKGSHEKETGSKRVSCCYSFVIQGGTCKCFSSLGPILLKGVLNYT